MKKFYVTTPLYYVNAAPHIGHAYTTLAADIIARYKRMQGTSVYFLTGTDEHGQKVEAAARDSGVKPLAYADDIVEKFKEMWKHLDIQYDDFIRTTDKRHTTRVQAVFEHLIKKGDIYKGIYEGYYCVSDETYWTETDAPPDKKGRRLCPNKECRKPLHLTAEECYKFKLSRFQQPLLDHYRAHPEFLQPPHRANEMIRLVEEGLRDLAVSRTKVKWGVPLLRDRRHVVYVWFDALLNYVTAPAFNPPGMENGGESSFEDFWPADVQLVGKEIYRFHTVIWPAMLMALDIPLPKTVFAHGWWTIEGEKVSKSKGNLIDPRDITREFGVDAFRYGLFREMPFGNDGRFSVEGFRARYNSELANDLGNLLSRVTNMVDKYLGGALPGKPAEERITVAKELLAKSDAVNAAMNRLAFQEALNVIWSGIRRLNEHVDKTKPWAMAKTDMEGVKYVLFDLATSLRVVAGWLTPFMPQTAAKIQTQLGVRRGNEPPDAPISKGPPLFPRK